MEIQEQQYSSEQYEQATEPTTGQQPDVAEDTPPAAQNDPAPEYDEIEASIYESEPTVTPTGAGGDFFDFPPEPESSRHHFSDAAPTEPSDNPQPPRVYYEESIKKEKKKGSMKKFIAGVLILSLVGGGSIGLGIGFSDYISDRFLVSSDADNTIEATTEMPFQFGNSSEVVLTSTTSAQEYAIVDIVDSVQPSVVNINSTRQSTTSFFNMYDVPIEQTGAGSGIIFHDDGTKVYIVTNNHVIDGATYVSVSFDNDESITAELVGTDPQTDIAVISLLKSDLQAAGVESIRLATFGDSSTLKVGETAIAIGNALGEGKTATRGIISAVSKKINVDGKVLDVIQTDAAINEGNSGGALVNGKGQVIGINTAKLQGSAIEGMGFAIPSNSLKPIVEELMASGYIKRPYLGITGQNITDDLAELYQLPIGVLVRSVVQGSSADLAGIKQGDIITEFDGAKIMNMDQLTTAIKNKSVGDKISIRLIRDGQTATTVEVTLQDANQSGRQQ